MPSLVPFLLILVAAVSGGVGEEKCLEARLAYQERYFQNRHEGAEARISLIGEAERLIGQYKRTAPQCTGSVYENLTYLYVLGEEYTAAEEAIQSYLRDVDARATPRSQIAMRSQLAYVLLRLGKTMASSQAYYDAASRADRAPAYFGTYALVRAASSARAMGDFDSADAYLISALDIVRDSIKTNPELEEIQGEAMLTRALLILEQIDQGVMEASRDSLIARLDETSADAVSMLKRTSRGVGNQSIAMATHAMAAALSGDLDEAMARLHPALSLARSAGRTSPLSLYNAYATASRIRNLGGDYDGARRDAEAALAEAIRLSAIAEHAIALTMLGRIAEDRDDWTTAAAWYAEAVDVREVHRDQLGLQDWSLSRFATMQAPYQGLVRARVALGDIEGALTVLDQTRARHLRDLTAHIRLREKLSPQVRQSVQVLLDSLEHVREAEAQPHSSSAVASLATERTRLQAEIERVTGTPAVTDDSLDVSALRRRLGDRTLVAYSIDEVSSIAFVVRPDTVLAVDLGVSGSGLRGTIREIGSMWSGASPDPSFSLRALHQLYQSLVEPIRPHVVSDRVVFVPDAELASVPFGMLTTSPAEDYATAAYLVRDWAISTELAAALLVTPPPPQLQRGIDLLVLGQSRFDPSFTWNGSPLADLPDVQTEVNRIGRYGQSSDVQINGSSGEATYQNKAPNSRVIHIASHAEANAKTPLNSRIALSPGDGEDGTLHLYELMTTSLQADLVVLSGCSTADGGGRAGEGIVGLQYGMRAAGAEATLATLWAVADGTMSDLTDSFYRNLSEGQTKDHALRSAQLAYLATHEGIEASPFFWAAPVLSGDASSIPLTRRTDYRWLWALAVGMAVIGLVWGLRLRTSNA